MSRFESIREGVNRYKELITGSKAKQLAKELTDINNKISVNERKLNNINKYRDLLDKSYDKVLQSKIKARSNIQKRRGIHTSDKILDDEYRVNQVYNKQHERLLNLMRSHVNNNDSLGLTFDLGKLRIEKAGKQIIKDVEDDLVKKTRIGTGIGGAGLVGGGAYALHRRRKRRNEEYKR